MKFVKVRCYNNDQVDRFTSKKMTPLMDLKKPIPYLKRIRLLILSYESKIVFLAVHYLILQRSRTVYIFASHICCLMHMSSPLETAICWSMKVLPKRPWVKYVFVFTFHLPSLRLVEHEILRKVNMHSQDAFIPFVHSTFANSANTRHTFW